MNSDKRKVGFELDFSTLYLPSFAADDREGESKRLETIQG